MEIIYFEYIFKKGNYKDGHVTNINYNSELPKNGLNSNGWYGYRLETEFGFIDHFWIDPYMFDSSILFSETHSARGIVDNYFRQKKLERLLQ